VVNFATDKFKNYQCYQYDAKINPNHYSKGIRTISCVKKPEYYYVRQFWPKKGIVDFILRIRDSRVPVGSIEFKTSSFTKLKANFSPEITTRFSKNSQKLSTIDHAVLEQLTAPGSKLDAPHKFSVREYDLKRKRAH
jgi:hypothetical protein